MEQSKNSRVVLVVDDEADTRLLVSRYISACFGCEIFQASSGAEAVLMLETLQVDIVLCDYDMPNMTGIEVARSLVDASITSKIVFYTGTDLQQLDLSHKDVDFFAVNKPHINSLAQHISYSLGWEINKKVKGVFG